MMMEMMLNHVAHPSVVSPLRRDATAGSQEGVAEAGTPMDAATLEAAHLDAADELLGRHGLSLADCRISRECVGIDAEDDAVLYVVHVGEGIDTYALNEALTALQLARGLQPSAQLDVVFQP